MSQFATLRALLRLIQVRLSQFNGASHAGSGVAIWQTQAGPASIGDREVDVRGLRTSGNIVDNDSARAGTKRSLISLQWCGRYQ